MGIFSCIWAAIEQYFTILNPNPHHKRNLYRRSESLFLGAGKFSRSDLLVVAFMIQVCLGSKYAWSIYNKAIEKELSVASEEVSRTLSITIIFVGLGNFLGGPMISRNGPRVLALIGSALFFSGHFVAALGCFLKRLWLIYLGYGALTGFGAGITFLCPVFALHRYFPDRKGLASGFAVGGYGAGIAIGSIGQAALIKALGITNTFLVLGAAYACIQIPCALTLRFPSLNISYLPESKAIVVNEDSSNSEGASPTTSDEAKKPTNSKLQQEHGHGGKISPEHARFSTLKSVLTSPFFLLCYILILTHQVSGLLLLTRVSDLLSENLGMNPEYRPWAVAAIGIFNAGGRIIMGLLCDRAPASRWFLITISSQIVAVSVVWFSIKTTSLILFLVGTYSLVFCYGSAFAMLSVLLIEIFGGRWLDRIFGITLTGFSLDGLITGALGPALLRMGKDAYKGSPDLTKNMYNSLFMALYPFLILGILSVTAIIIALYLRSRKLADSAKGPYRS